MALSCSKKLSALLRGITSSQQKKALNYISMRVCKNKDSCSLSMSTEDTIML